MEALRAKRMKGGKFAGYYTRRSDESPLLVLLFSPCSPSNENDALTRHFPLLLIITS